MGFRRSADLGRRVGLPGQDARSGRSTLIRMIDLAPNRALLHPGGGMAGMAGSSVGKWLRPAMLRVDGWSVGGIPTTRDRPTMRLRMNGRSDEGAGDFRERNPVPGQIASSHSPADQPSKFRRPGRHSCFHCRPTIHGRWQVGRPPLLCSSPTDHSRLEGGRLPLRDLADQPSLGSANQGGRPFPMSRLPPPVSGTGL